jgi:hypothetical protein
LVPAIAAGTFQHTRLPEQTTGFACFIAMTRGKSPTVAERADRHISNQVKYKRDTGLMRLIGTLSDVGDQPQMRILIAATITYGVVKRDERIVKTGLKMLAAHTLATWGKSKVKSVVDRTRPKNGNDPRVRLGDSDAHEDTSFPSGHSAGAVAVAQAFARSYPEHAVAARAAAFAVAAIQVPRGTHYVGDVIAGTLIGIGAEQASGAAGRLSGSAVHAALSRSSTIFCKV